MNSRAVFTYQSLGSSVKYTAVICHRRDGQKDVSNKTFTAALGCGIHGSYRAGVSGSVLPKIFFGHYGPTSVPLVGEDKINARPSHRRCAKVRQESRKAFCPRALLDSLTQRSSSESDGFESAAQNFSRFQECEVVFCFGLAIGNNGDFWQKRVFCSPLTINGIEDCHREGMISRGRHPELPDCAPRRTLFALQETLCRFMREGKNTKLRSREAETGARLRHSAKAKATASSEATKRLGIVAKSNAKQRILRLRFRTQAKRRWTSCSGCRRQWKLPAAGCPLPAEQPQ